MWTRCCVQCCEDAAPALFVSLRCSQQLCLQPTFMDTARPLLVFLFTVLRVRLIRCWVSCSHSQRDRTRRKKHSARVNRQHFQGHWNRPQTTTHMCPIATQWGSRSWYRNFVQVKLFPYCNFLHVCSWHSAISSGAFGWRNIRLRKSRCFVRHFSPENEYISKSHKSL